MDKVTAVCSPIPQALLGWCCGAKGPSLREAKSKANHLSLQKAQDIQIYSITVHHSIAQCIACNTKILSVSCCRKWKIATATGRGHFCLQ